MSMFSNYQSIFQLVAGISIGFSGIISLFDDPLSKESQKLAALSKRTRAISNRYPSIGNVEKDQIQSLSNDIDNYLDNIIRESNDQVKFPILKMLAFGASIAGFVLLIYASEIPQAKMSSGLKFASYVLLACVPAMTIYVAHWYRSISRSYAANRKTLDNRYIAIVDQISLQI